MQRGLRFPFEYLLTIAGTATAFPLRLCLHFKAAHAAGVKFALAECPLLAVRDQHAFEASGFSLPLRHAIRERGRSQTVHERYTHQIRVLSSSFANLLIPKNCTFRSITVAFPFVSVTYCFKSELIIPWSLVRVQLGPPRAGSQCLGIS